jgi:DNA invertase Pin-like site-specific DNA recombinase
MANALIVHNEHLLQSQKMDRAAQYVRMSTDYQQYSIENQAVVIATYAQLHKLTIIRTYRDEGESGLRIENRAGLTELIDDVETGRADFDHLLIFDVSRWGRFQDVDESAYYEFVCRRAGIKVAYCAEQFDNDGSLLSNIMKNIKRVMAAEFSRELSAKVYAGASRLAALGFKQGGPAPYGLQRRVVDEKFMVKGVLKDGERKFLITDRVRLAPATPDQTEVVKLIFDEYVRHRSQASVIRELNRRGILNNRGKPWSQSTLSILLQNEAYIGTYTYNRVTQKLGAKRTCNPKHLWIRSDGAIDPIVERDVFLRAKKVMQERCVKIPEEEMLVRLRKLLMKRGKLNCDIIDKAPNIPSLSTYLVHFGTLRNIYRLIGYTGNQDYWDRLAAHEKWACLNLNNASRLRDGFAKAGREAILDPAVECLRIDSGVSVSFRIAKWRKYEGRHLRWTMMRRARWPNGWVAALRLGENNKSILDFILLPSTSIPDVRRVFWFSERTRAAHGIEKFATFDELSKSLIKRVCKTALGNKRNGMSQ